MSKTFTESLDMLKPRINNAPMIQFTGKKSAKEIFDEQIIPDFVDFRMKMMSGEKKQLVNMTYILQGIVIGCLVLHAFIKKHKCIDVATLDALADTYTRKNKDYGDSFATVYRDMGLVSAYTRIADKYYRIQNLLGGDALEPIGTSTHHSISANYESLEDSLLDTVNYCVMSIMMMHNEGIK